jgi:hypothetical protein
MRVAFARGRERDLRHELARGGHPFDHRLLRGRCVLRRLHGRAVAADRERGG